MRCVTRLFDKETIERLRIPAKNMICSFMADIREKEHYIPVLKHFSTRVMGHVESLELRKGDLYATLSNKHIEEENRVDFSDFEMSSTNILDGKLIGIFMFNR